MRNFALLAILILVAVFALLLVTSRHAHQGRGGESVDGEACRGRKTRLGKNGGEAHRTPENTDNTPAATTSSAHNSGTGDTPPTNGGSIESGPRDDAFTVLERAKLREMNFTTEAERYPKFRSEILRHYGFENWPRDRVGLKAGFKFDAKDYSALNHYEAFPPFTFFEFGGVNPTDTGLSMSGTVYWGIGGYKCGVQRTYGFRNGKNQLFVKIFVGDTPRDAHVNMIDMTFVGPTSAPGEFRPYSSAYIRDRVRLGDVCMADRGESPRGLMFVRANIFVRVEFISPPSGEPAINMIELGQDIDTAIKREPDVDDAGMEAMRPKFVKCAPRKRTLVDSEKINSQGKSDAVSELILETTDPRGDVVSFTRYGRGERVKCTSGHVIAPPGCPEGEHSAYITAINEHLLFTVCEIKVRVEREK